MASLDKSNVSAQTMASRVIPFATKMNGDAELLNDMEMATAAKSVVRRGPNIIRHDLVRVFGKELDGMPVPDSEGGNNPDLYALPNSKRKGSFYNDLFDAYKWGAGIKALLDACKLAEKPETVNEAEAAFKKMSRDDLIHASAEKLAGEVEKAKKERAYGRSVIKNAMLLHFQLAALDTLKGIKVQPVLDEEGNLWDGPAPYIIRDADLVTKPGDFKYFSVDTINKIPVEKVAEAGGTYKALLASLKREKEQPETVEVPALSIQTVAPYLERVGQLLQKVDANDELEAQLLQYLMSDAGDDALLWAFRAGGQLQILMARPELRKRFVKLEAELADDTAQAA